MLNLMTSVAMMSMLVLADDGDDDSARQHIPPEPTQRSLHFLTDRRTEQSGSLPQLRAFNGVADVFAAALLTTVQVTCG